MQLTVEQITAMSTPELIAKYNELTGKSIKKFSSRVAGEKQVLKASNGEIHFHKGNTETAQPEAAVGNLGANMSAASNNTAVKAAKRIAKKAGKKKVKGKATGEKRGRPKNSYTVTLSRSAAQSKPHSNSLRMQLITYLDKLDSKSASIEQIEKKFEAPMRGVINKLRETKWVKTHDKE